MLYDICIHYLGSMNTCLSRSWSERYRRHAKHTHQNKDSFREREGLLFGNPASMHVERSKNSNDGKQKPAAKQKRKNQMRNSFDASLARVSDTLYDYD